jgi:hypothetical protein
MVVRFSAVMGAEREDTDSRVKRPSTEPGIGAPPSARSGETPAAAEVDAGAVDFDALHAALGDPLDLDELPPVSSSQGAHEAPGAPPLPPPPRAKSSPSLAESSGRSSATYASARPRTIPPTRAPVEEPNVPPVIVASDDTAPSAPPAAMTVPMARPAVPPVGRGSDPYLGAPGSGPHLGAPGSGPHLGAPGPASSGQHANAAPAYGFAPPAFGDGPPLQRQPRNAAQMTMRMPDRPISPIHPRRPAQATIVVRARGPSARQKLFVFMAMLLLVTACGIAVTIWRSPSLFGIGPAGGGSAPPSTGTSVGGDVPPSTVPPSTVVTAPAPLAPMITPATPTQLSAAASAAPSPPAVTVRARPAKQATPAAATAPLR